MTVYVVIRSDLMPDCGEEGVETDEIVGVYTTAALAYVAIVQAVKALDELDGEGERDWVWTGREEAALTDAGIRVRVEKATLNALDYRP